jgi:hypothetical protein
MRAKMTKALEILGQKFGKLTAIERIVRENPEKGGQRSQWLFKCECGNTRISKASAVVKGFIKSCKKCTEKEYKSAQGARGRNKRYEPKEASFRAKASNIKAHAKVRNIPWELTLEQASEILKMNCYFSGHAPSNQYNTFKNRSAKQTLKYEKENVLERGEILYNGIDRLNSDLGYTVENSVPCCTFCNIAKNDRPAEEFITWLDQLVEFRSKK